MVFRFDAPMFFANSTYFLERTRELIVAQDPPLRVLIMDMQGVVSIDSTAMEALTSLLDELDEAGTRFIVVRARRAVRMPLARAGLAERIGEENFFQSLRLAVNVAVRDSGGK
jgi:SulP family sulfate permease